MVSAISIVTGNMNRQAFLETSLKTWMRLREVNEIVIVDWSSTIPLHESLANFNDSRIQFVRVIGRPYWENSRCHNLEFKVVSNELVLRIDSDCLVSENFFTKHSIDDNRQLFYTGYWESVPLTKTNKRSLTGAIFATKSQLSSVNGYNERLVHYGREDDDLYNRLVRQGFERRLLDLETLDHIPHANELRYENLLIASQLTEAIKDDNNPEMWPHQRECNYLLNLSYHIEHDHPWSSSDSTTKWAIERATRNLSFCVEIAT